MPWTVSVPVVPSDDFDVTVNLAVDREKETLAGLGATHAADLAADAAKKLLKSWDVAGDSDRTFGATLSGHANPGGEPVGPAGNDEITVTVYRSGNRALSVEDRIKEAVKAAIKEHDAKLAKAAESKAVEAKHT